MTWHGMAFNERRSYLFLCDAPVSTIPPLVDPSTSPCPCACASPRTFPCPITTCPCPCPCPCPSLCSVPVALGGSLSPWCEVAPEGGTYVGFGQGPVLKY